MNNQPKRIPVKLAKEPGVPYTHEPMTFGVPFAEGTFPADTSLRAVTAEGRIIPVQTRVMTTWKKDLRDIKWLLADLQADPATDGDTVFLEYGIENPTPEPEQTITTSQTDGILSIDTGALRLRLRTSFELWKDRECDSPIAGCEVRTADGWREMLHGAGLLLYMQDQRGHLTTSIGAFPPPKVVIEEQGPLRVCVLITGHLTSDEGIRFCPYRMRLHLYAGKADLRICHTFIFDQDPTRIQLAAVGLKVLMRPGDNAMAAIGGEGDAAYESPAAQELSLVQTDDLNHRTRLHDQSYGSGEKAAGWATLSGSSASVTATIRDFWLLAHGAGGETQDHLRGLGCTDTRGGAHEVAVTLHPVWGQAFHHLFDPAQIVEVFDLKAFEAQRGGGLGFEEFHDFIFIAGAVELYGRFGKGGHKTERFRCIFGPDTQIQGVAIDFETLGVFLPKIAYGRGHTCTRTT